jgi:hypothetical protein
MVSEQANYLVLIKRKNITGMRKRDVRRVSKITQIVRIIIRNNYIHHLTKASKKVCFNEMHS